MKFIETQNAPQAIGPYSQAVVANGFLFASGQIPLSPTTGEIVGTTIEEQSLQVLLNIKGLLESQELSLNSIVKTTCFLADMGDFAAFNTVYSQYMVHKPARSTVAVKELPKKVLVEIEVIAVL